MRLLTEFVMLRCMKKEKANIISDERRLYDLKPMSDVLTPLARKMLGDKAFIEADIMCNWEDIVGENLAGFTTPMRIDFKRGERKNGVLILQVAGGAMALELQLKEKQLIAKVNAYFGYEAVSRIRIMQDTSLPKNVKQPTDNSEKILVTEEQENYIKQQVNGIENAQLAETLQKLGRAVWAKTKKEEESGTVYKKN